MEPTKFVSLTSNPPLLTAGACAPLLKAIAFDGPAMLLLVGTVLGFLLAGSAFLLVRGLVGLFRRRPKAALALLGGVGLFVVVVILLGIASYLLGPRAEALDPAAEKALVLAKNISALMNLSFLGLPFGVLMGLVAEVRARRSSDMPLQHSRRQ